MKLYEEYLENISEQIELAALGGVYLGLTAAVWFAIRGLVKDAEDEILKNTKQCTLMAKNISNPKVPRKILLYKCQIIALDKGIQSYKSKILPKCKSSKKPDKCVKAVSKAIKHLVSQKEDVVDDLKYELENMRKFSKIKGV